MDLSWTNLGSITAACGLGMTVAGLMLRGWLVGKVVAPGRVEDLERRMGAVEKLAEAAVSHDDWTEMQDRLTDVDKGLAGVQATVGGIKDSVERIEHQFDMIFENALREKAGVG